MLGALILAFVIVVVLPVTHPDVRRRRGRPAGLDRQGRRRRPATRAASSSTSVVSRLSAAGSHAPAGLAEAVADRPDGLDEVGVLLAELGAEAPDVDVDRAGAAVVLVAPHPATAASRG